jgi:transposase
MSGLSLTARQRCQLEDLVRTSRDAGAFRRALALLEVAAGTPVVQVARLLRASRVSVHHWIARYRASPDPAAVLDRRGGNRPTVWTDGLQAALRDSLAHPPDHFGYQAVEWTADLLRDQLVRSTGQPLSTATLRRRLHALGYVCKRPRHMLDPDPQREQKTVPAPAPAKPAAAPRAAVRG